MLASVFKWKLPDISSSLIIKDLFRSFSKTRPPKPVAPPTWDVNTVLRALCRPPYEPLSNASFRDLSKKTLFLVSLAMYSQKSGRTTSSLLQNSKEVS